MQRAVVLALLAGLTLWLIEVSHGTSTEEASFRQVHLRSPATGPQLSDAEFVTLAGMDAMTEIQLGQLVLRKSQSGHVKHVAQLMISDHMRANSDLVTLALTKHLTPPAELDPLHQSLVDDLTARYGAEMDARYLDDIKKSQAVAISFYALAATKSSDLDVSAFAKNALPIMRMHNKLLGAAPYATTSRPE